MVRMSVSEMKSPHQLQEGGPLLGPVTELINEFLEETHVLTEQEISLERAPGWRAGVEGNPGELLSSGKQGHCSWTKVEKD